MRVPLAAVGFTSIIGQIILMRELVATFYGNELLLGLVLMTWLAWGAVGSWGLPWLVATGLPGTWRTRLSTLAARAFAVGLVVAGLLLLAQLALVRGARVLLGVTPGALVEVGPMVAAVILLLAPLCLLTGFLFSWGARLTVERGGTGGQAYTWESIGSVVGGTLFSFVFIHWLDPFQTALLVGATNLSVAGYLLMLQSQGFPRRAGSELKWLGLFLVLAVLGLPLGRLLHQTALRWQWNDLIFAADSPYGRIVIQARDGQRIFFQNGLLAFETQGTFPEEVVHFPLLAHPDPHTVLLIGGGIAGDLRETLKHPITGVTYVELDPLLIEAGRIYLPPGDATVLNDPRVSLVLSDGRSYVKGMSGANRLTSRPVAQFDVVILDLPEPATGALNRFYTREFFQEIQAIMSPGAVFALGLPSAENYWSPELAQRNGSVYYTLRAVFSEIMVLPGEHNFFLASDRPLEANPVTLSGRLVGRGIENRLMRPEYIEYVFTTDRFTRVQQELEALQGVRLNRDLAPICYYYDLVLWLSRFYPNPGGTLIPEWLWGANSGLVGFAGVAIVLVLGVALARWQRRWAIFLAITGVGLAAMTVEVVILFAFQVLHGYVYAQVSLIVTAFMAGLALGAAGSNWAVARWPLALERRAKWTLVGVQLAIAVYSGAFALILWLPVSIPAPGFPLLALWGGGLAGMAFPLALACVRGQGDAGRAAGKLYAADLVGGCLGAGLGAVLFVPLLGVPHTSLFITLVALACLAALV